MLYHFTSFIRNWAPSQTCRRVKNDTTTESVSTMSINSFSDASKSACSFLRMTVSASGTGIHSSLLVLLCLDNHCKITNPSQSARSREPLSDVAPRASALRQRCSTRLPPLVLPTRRRSGHALLPLFLRVLLLRRLRRVLLNICDNLFRQCHHTRSLQLPSRTSR